MQQMIHKKTDSAQRAFALEFAAGEPVQMLPPQQVTFEGEYSLQKIDEIGRRQSDTCCRLGRDPLKI